MKESSIDLKPTRVFNPKNQCHGKKQYSLKRRAIKRAHEYAKLSGDVYTVYQCPHCNQFHIGKERIK